MSCTPARYEEIREEQRTALGGISHSPTGQQGGAGNFSHGDAHTTPQHLPFDGDHQHSHLGPDGLAHDHSHNHAQDYNHEHDHSQGAQANYQSGGGMNFGNGFGGGGFNGQAVQPAEPPVNAKPDKAYKSQWNQGQ